MPHAPNSSSELGGHGETDLPLAKHNRKIQLCSNYAPNRNEWKNQAKTDQVFQPHGFEPNRIIRLSGSHRFFFRASFRSF
jgi:hypothetical protein